MKPLLPIADVTSWISDAEIVGFSVGPDDVVYLLLATAQLDYRVVRPGGASFAKVKPDHPQSYRIVAIADGRVIRELTISGERFNYHHIQPLPDGDVLLACARSQFRSAGDYDRNGRVFDRHGRLLREVLLGDGIQAIQTTDEGTIWTSFFDEGVFGNYGWSAPVGASGLVAWGSFGNKVFEFAPSDGLDAICDCYALNVVSRVDTWCYYYTGFPLVWIHQQKIRAWWHIPLGGSDAFAIYDDVALFRGGYVDRDTYWLVRLCDNQRIEVITNFALENEQGNALVAGRAVGRGKSLYLLSSNRVYRVGVLDAL
jgi:hypothetical protein